VWARDRYIDGKDTLNRGNSVKYLVLWSCSFCWNIGHFQSFRVRGSRI
jgi:hypothetical protein